VQCEPKNTINVDAFIKSVGKVQTPTKERQMSVSSIKRPGVEVHIWLPRDGDGNYTNAGDGGVREKKQDGTSRVGHASLKIYLSSEDQKKYSHLIQPGKDHVYASLWPAPQGFQKVYEDDLDPKRGEGERPNAIIRLNNLNIPRMLEAMNKSINATNWKLVGLADPSSTDHSCSSFVLMLLGQGGLDTESGYEGPANQAFYEKTNSHLGDILSGFFNKAFWRGLAVSPKLVLHIAAAAAERDPTSKQDTTNLMDSSLIHKDVQVIVASNVPTSQPLPPTNRCGTIPCTCQITDPFFALLIKTYNSKPPENHKPT
jgi:hypothetical protein